jgi:hypothetical protein
VVTTTCCSNDQFMIIMRESDGYILKAAKYPESDGTYDVRTRNMVLAGPNSANEYQVTINV